MRRARTASRQARTSRRTNRDATSTLAFPGQLDERSAHDGDVFSTSLNNGWTLGQSGYLQFRRRGPNRAGHESLAPDTRRSTFRRAIRATRMRRDASSGRATRTIATANCVFNAGPDCRPRRRALRIWGYGRMTAAPRRKSWRRPNDDRTVRSIYPDGFLPFIKSDIADASLVGRIERRWTRLDVGSRHRLRPQCISVHDRQQRQRVAGQLVEDVVRRRRSRRIAVDDNVRSPSRGANTLARGASRRTRRRVSRRPVRDHGRRSDSYRDGGVSALDASGSADDATSRRSARRSFPDFAL